MGFIIKSSLFYSHTGLFDPLKGKQLTAQAMAQSFNGDQQYDKKFAEKSVPQVYPNCIPNRGVDEINGRIYKEYAEIIFHTHSVNSKITVLK